MRTFRLMRVVMEAEMLRYQAMLRRNVSRAIMGVIALIFGLAALVLLHVIGYILLRHSLEPVYAALIILGVDVVVAILFGLLAMRSSPSSEEREAYRVRDQAMHQLRSAMTLTALIPVAQMAFRARRGRGRR